MKICKECGSIMNEPRFKLLVKIVRSDGSSAQQGHQFEKLQDVRNLKLFELFNRARAEMEKMK